MKLTALVIIGVCGAHAGMRVHPKAQIASVCPDLAQTRDAGTDRYLIRSNVSVPPAQISSAGTVVQGERTVAAAFVLRKNAGMALLEIRKLVSVQVVPLAGTDQFPLIQTVRVRAAPHAGTALFPLILTVRVRAVLPVWMVQSQMIQTVLV